MINNPHARLGTSNCPHSIFDAHHSNYDDSLPSEVDLLARGAELEAALDDSDIATNAGEPERSSWTGNARSRNEDLKRSHND
jgi:hypothetical protein